MVGTVVDWEVARDRCVPMRLGLGSFGGRVSRGSTGVAPWRLLPVTGARGRPQQRGGAHGPCLSGAACPPFDHPSLNRS